jgi:hypothetical protein
MTAIFLRILQPSDKEGALLDAVRAHRAGRRDAVYEVDPEGFRSVPRSPFAYWVSSAILRLFSAHPAFQHAGRIAASTNPLAEDGRFVRLWWEVRADQLGTARMPWAKGGQFSPFYCDIPTVIDWDPKRGTYTGFLGGTSAWRRFRRHDDPGTTDTRPMEPPTNFGHFLRPGLTWPRRTAGLSFRVLPRGAIFADKGPALFIEGDEPAALLALCAIVNSRTFAYLMEVQLARTELAQSYEVGLVQQSPMPELGDDQKEALAALAGRAWSLQRALDATSETSHAFMLPQALSALVSAVDQSAALGRLAEIQHGSSASRSAASITESPPASGSRRRSRSRSIRCRPALPACGPRVSRARSSRRRSSSTICTTSSTSSRT